MKFIKFLMMLLVGFIACSDPQPKVVIQQTPQVVQTPQYTTHQNPTTGQQMVVFKDNSGVEQMMEYMMFMSLLNSMGDGGCWNCVYGRRDYYRPRNEIKVYRQYTVVPDRSYRNSNNYNRASTNNSKSGTATSGYGNGIQNTTLQKQTPNVGQSTQPQTNVGQNGIQNTTLKRQSPTGMPPPIVKPTSTPTSSGIKNTTLSKKK